MTTETVPKKRAPRKKREPTEEEALLEKTKAFIGCPTGTDKRTALIAALITFEIKARLLAAGATTQLKGGDSQGMSNPR